MSNKYFKISFVGILIVAFLASMFPVLAKDSILIDSAVNKSSLKFKDNRPNRPVFQAVIPTDFDAFMLKMTSLKTGLSANNKVQALKNSSKAISNLSVENSKPIDNVKIYPNPVTDQINISYTLKKESLVTVKVLDVLGNEVAVLLSQKINAGEQSNTFYLDSKITSGFYFVRVIAGSDSIVKRISVL